MFFYKTFFKHFNYLIGYNIGSFIELFPTMWFDS